MDDISELNKEYEIYCKCVYDDWKKENPFRKRSRKSKSFSKKNTKSSGERGA